MVTNASHGGKSSAYHQSTAPPTHHPHKKRLLTQKLSVPRREVFQIVSELLGNLEDYYNESFDDGELYYSDRILTCSCSVRSNIALIEPRVQQLMEIAPRYDFDKDTPGNGYRSIVCVVDTAILQIIRLIRTMNDNRASLLFRRSHFCKEFEALTSVLDFLARALTLMAEYRESWPHDRLIPDVQNAAQFRQLMEIVDNMDTSCFYGRAIGFQFCSSVTRVFGVIGIALAAYSVSWEENISALTSLITSSKFLLSPELRAKRIVEVVKHADISFCKGFWNLGEGQFMTHMPDWFCPRLQVNEPIEIMTQESLWLEGGEPGGCSSLECLNPKLSGKSGTTELSPSLLFHCHGGGFVANSPKSHETYLRHWAKTLDCPLLTIDYALAPENPFPRAIEEIMYAYAWAHHNAEILGWTGERICLVGDSAGGNLLTAVALKLIDLGVRRVADGMVLAYTPFMFQYLPSPSRILTVMDPLLPMGIVLRCLHAYTDGSSATTTDTTTADNHDQQSEPFTATTAAMKNHTSPSRRGSKKTLQDYHQEMASEKAPTPQKNFDQNQPIVGLLNLAANQTNKLSDETAQKLVDDANVFVWENVIDRCSSTDEDKEDDDLVYDESLDQANSSRRQRSKSESSGFVVTNNGISDMNGKSAGKCDDDNNNNDDDDDQNKAASSNSGTTKNDENNSAKVVISKDPTRIWLSSSLYDDSLLDYFRKHDLTKNSLVLTDSSGSECSSFSAESDISSSGVASSQMFTSSSSSPSITNNNNDNAEAEGRSSSSKKITHKTKLRSATSPVDLRSSSTTTTTSIMTTDSDESDDDVGFGIIDVDEFYLPPSSPNPSIHSLPVTVNNNKTLLGPTASIRSLGYDNIGGGSGGGYHDESNLDEPFKKPRTSLGRSISMKVTDTVSWATGHAYDHLSAWFDSPESLQSQGSLERKSKETSKESPIAELRLHKGPQSMLISPLTAPDHILAQLPPIYLITGQLDPLLDDTVEFGRKVRDVGGNVSVQLLDALPHGFLNFTLVSGECRQGAKVCINRIRDVLFPQ